MEIDQLIDSLSSDTLRSLAAFRPELALCATIVLLLLLHIVGVTSRIHSFWIALVGSAVALWFAAPWQNLDVLTDPDAQIVARDTEYYVVGPQQATEPDGTLHAGAAVSVVRKAGSYWQVRTGAGRAVFVAASDLAPSSRQEIFTGMLVYDNFTTYFRVVLLLFAVLFVVFTRISGIPDRQAAPDFYALVLGATLGMCLMVSANHLLMVFLGVEMASVPSYALAGALKGRRRSSEAALKYAVYGAGTAGVMLYGISLLAGILGSVHIPTMAVRLAALLDAPSAAGAMDRYMVLTLGALMMMVGIAFKLSAVPFHFWCPDVFHGASAEVAAFLSVASKAAALALLVRVALGFTHLPERADSPQPVAARAETSAETRAHRVPIRAVSQAAPARDVSPRASNAGDASPPAGEARGANASAGEASRSQSLAPARQLVGNLLVLVAIITCTFGNLAAYGQTNIKRLLAYSTIAHAGYMMMPVAAAVLMADTNPQGARDAIGALVFYMTVYLFMNLGAFAIVAFLRNEIHSEEIADYGGLVRRSPITVVCFSILLFSLIGVPPLAGFIGKFLIFLSLVEANLWTLLVIAGLNTVLSLFYYLRVVKAMTMEPEPADRLPVSIPFIPGTFIVAMTLPIVVFFLWWDGLSRWAMAAAAHLLA